MFKTRWYLHADYEADLDAAYRLIHWLSSHVADLVCLRRSTVRRLAIRPLATVNINLKYIRDE